jgi:cupin 2 domain-containing protein
MQTGNLYSNSTAPATGERFDTLLTHRGLVIERIVSSSKIELQTCVQPQDEWVVLVEGEALLNVNGQAVPLRSGDHVFLPAQTPHTVLSVSQGAMWLAVHLHAQPLGGV